MSIQIFTRAFAACAALALTTTAFAQAPDDPPAEPQAGAQTEADAELAQDEPAQDEAAPDAQGDIEADVEAEADAPAQPLPPGEQQPQQPTQPEAPADAQPQGETPAPRLDPQRDPAEQQRDPRAEADSQREGRSADEGRSAREMNLGAEFNIEQNQLVVTNIEQNTVFARSGISRGDVIVSVFGRPVASQVEFYRFLQTAPAGQPVPVVVLRDGRRQVIELQITEVRGYRPDPAFTSRGAWLGVHLDTRYQDRAVVTQVQQGSPADQAGVQQGDWIVSVNDQQIADSAHLSQVIRQMEPGAQIGLAVVRQVQNELPVTLGRRPAPVDAPSQFDRPLRPAPPQGEIETRGEAIPREPLRNQPRDRRLFDGDRRILD